MQRQLKAIIYKGWSNSILSLSRQRSDYADITSYLTYAKLNAVSTTSTVFRGTYYELQTKHLLENVFLIKSEDINMNGGSYDEGIDILAKWNLDQYRIAKEHHDEVLLKKKSQKIVPLINRKPGKNGNSETLMVDLLIQCKIASKKIPSKLLRELSGIYNRHISPRNKSKSFMMLVSNNVLTEDAMKFFTGVNIPMIFIQLELPYLKPSKKIQDEYKIKNYKKGSLILYYRNPRAKMLLHGLRDYEDINMKILEQVLK